MLEMVKRQDRVEQHERGVIATVNITPNPFSLTLPTLTERRFKPRS